MADQPEDNIFASAPPQAPAQQTQEPVQATDAALADLLKGIVNEQGQQKYDSLPKALEGLAHAQQYIPQLKTELTKKEQELETLRQELAQRASVEDVVTRLTAQKQEPQGQGTPPESSGLNEQAVLQLVRQALGQAKAEDQAALNHKQVQQALSGKYGEKAAEVVAQKAKELGTTPDQLGQLASQNPAMVLALFNTAAPSLVKPTTGSVNFPLQAPERPQLEKPTKSLLAGATSNQQKDYMLKIKEDVHARLGVTQ